MHAPASLSQAEMWAVPSVRGRFFECLVCVPRHPLANKSPCVNPHSNQDVAIYTFVRSVSFNSSQPFPPATTFKPSYPYSSLHNSSTPTSESRKTFLFCFSFLQMLTQVTLKVVSFSQQAAPSSNDIGWSKKAAPRGLASISSQCSSVPRLPTYCTPAQQSDARGRTKGDRLDTPHQV